MIETEDWKEKIFKEVIKETILEHSNQATNWKEFGIDKEDLLDDMVEYATKIAISKTEQHFKDIMPHESYVKRQVERERLAFADWLEKWGRKHYIYFDNDGVTSRMNDITEIKAKIKELKEEKPYKDDTSNIF